MSKRKGSNHLKIDPVFGVAALKELAKGCQGKTYQIPPRQDRKEQLARRRYVWCVEDHIPEDQDWL
jgi:hypothetical protein